MEAIRGEWGKMDPISRGKTDPKGSVLPPAWLCDWIYLFWISNH